MPQTNSEALAPTLNMLMNGEFRAAHIYFQAAAWCEDAKLAGSAQFFLTHASEEMMHMQKIYQYIVDADLSARFEALPEPKIEANSLVSLLQEIYQHEKLVSERFIKATKEADQAGDLSTFEFLQWFIVEQREEEMLFRGILDRAAVIGDGPHSLYYIDTEIAKIAAAAVAAASATPAGGGA